MQNYGNTLPGPKVFDNLRKDVKMKHIPRCTIAVFAFVFVLAPPGLAQSVTLEPELVQEIQYSRWINMKPESYLIDIDDMDDRCLAGAAETSVTTAECQEAKSMLQAGQCRYQPIPDGTLYEFLMGLKAGKQHVYLNMVKRLGVTRMAYSCTVSTDRVIDWYVGEDKVSCGNVAARPLLTPVPALPMLVVEEIPEPPVEPKMEWVWVETITHYNSESGEKHIHMPGIIVPGCVYVYVPGQTFTFGGGSSKGYSRSAGWVLKNKETEE
jgi:hypothetical protein